MDNAKKSWSSIVSNHEKQKDTEQYRKSISNRGHKQDTILKYSAWAHKTPSNNNPILY
jgi:hypothetical protein